MIRKKIIIKITIALVIVTTTLILLSNTIENMLLPEVMVQISDKGNVERTVEVIGVTVPHTVVEIKAEENLTISQVLVKKDDIVEEGQIIAYVDINKYDVDIKKLQTQIKLLDIDIEIQKNDISPDYTSQENQIQRYREDLETILNKYNEQQNLVEQDINPRSSLDSYPEQIRLAENNIKDAESKLASMKKEYENSNKLKSYALEKLLLQRELLVLDLENLQKKVPSKKEILSPAAGIINEIHINDNQDLAKNKLIVEITIETDYYMTQWSEAIDVEKKFDEEGNVFVKVQGKSFMAKITENKYDPDIGMNVIKAEGKSGNVDVPVGLSVVISQKKTSEQNMVVPKGAIDILPGTNSGYVYILHKKEGILGLEYYVEAVKITVIEEGDLVCGIFSSPAINRMNVVTSSTKPLSDGIRVKYKGN